MPRTAQPSRRRGFQLPEIAFCEEKLQLLSSFYRSVHDFMALHQKMAAALMDGDHAFAELTHAIDRAREAKDRAKDAYLLHVKQHGCGTELVEAPSVIGRAAPRNDENAMVA